MRAVLTEMQRLSKLDSPSWARWRQSAYAIAKRNQERFFSAEFAHMIWQECLNNVDHALAETMRTRGHKWLAQHRVLRQQRPNHWYQYLRRPNERAKAALLRQLRQVRYTPSQSARSLSVSSLSRRDTISS